MNSEQKDVVIKLLRILKDKFSLDFEERWEEVKDLHLLGYGVGMSPRHMVYFFFEIEKVFGITIPEEYVVSGKFSTLANIADITGLLLESENSLLMVAEG